MSRRLSAPSLPSLRKPGRPSFKRRGKHQPVVGLELDPGHVALVQGETRHGAGPTASATAPLKPGVLRDGEVTEPGELTARIAELWAGTELPRRVRLGIANQRVVVRTLDLPPLTDQKAIAAAVAQEAPDHIPMPMEEAITDHEVIGLVDTPAGQRTRVVVVAVRREMVQRYIDAVRAADLEVAGIDLSAFALVRALAAPGDTEGLLYVNVAGLTNVAVAVGEHCLFTRAAAGGLDSMVHTLANRGGLTIEHATQWIHHVGLATPLDQVEGDPAVVGTVRSVLEEGTHQLADTVRNSLNFYRMQPNAEPVYRVVLSGPLTRVDGVPEQLGQKLSMPVEVRDVAGMDAADDDGRLAVAAGLAADR